jgi:hypothetical protein
MEEEIRKASIMDYVKVAKGLVYSYVKAVIVTGLCALEIYHGDDLIQSLPYELPGHVCN